MFSRILLRVALFPLAAAWAVGPSLSPAPQPGAHPLIGTIVQRDAQAAVQRLDREALLKRAATAEVLLLGEVHDNPQIHRLRAWLLSRLVDSGRRPAVAFEQIDLEHNDAVRDCQRRGCDADAVAAAVNWSASAWPPFALYRPIFEVVLSQGLEIRAANPGRDAVRRLALGETEPDATLRALNDSRSAAARAALEQTLLDSHCGMLPESALPGMVLAQTARDQAMAESLQGDGAQVLMAGNGHITASAVPWVLDRLGDTRSRLSIAWVEVEDAVTDLHKAVAAAPQADVVWWTARAQRPDPCAAFRANNALPVVKNLPR